MAAAAHKTAGWRDRPAFGSVGRGAARLPVVPGLGGQQFGRLDGPLAAHSVWALLR